MFRGGCLTGPQHAAVELHGYLAYIVLCAVRGRPYTIYGYKGKQVRDQIHSRDVVRLFLEFFRHPRAGEVYNMGGGRANSVSILETVDMLAAAGFRLDYSYNAQNRVGDHICYISDLAKIRSTSRLAAGIQPAADPGGDHRAAPTPQKRGAVES